MLYLNKNNLKVDSFSRIHFDFVKCLIRKRIGSSLTCNCDVCKSSYTQRTGVSKELIQILEDEENLKKLILSKPDHLKQANDDVFGIIFPNHSLTEIKDIRKRQNAFKEAKKKDPKQILVLDISTSEKKVLKTFQLLPKIIDYNDWFNKLDAYETYGPYQLAKSLDVRSCTYCNRQYTITVQSKTNVSGKLTRPQFDHWISKDEHPLLGLSFYNLIPSCPTCNSSVKGNAKFNTKKYIHPYLDELTSYIQFSFNYWSTIDEFQITVNSSHADPVINNKIHKTIKAFKIEEVYNGHLPELEDLIRLTKAYSPEYLRILKSSFPGANLTDEQIYRFAFGTELNINDFHKRPFSKFKHDILQELGIIKK